jgi:hypothetical protein
MLASSAATRAAPSLARIAPTFNSPTTGKGIASGREATSAANSTCRPFFIWMKEKASVSTASGPEGTLTGCT